jgi:ABC-type glycerol-3-phosphate transport system substrate-binding protein
MIFWIMPDNAAKTKAIMEYFLRPFKEGNAGVDICIKVIPRRMLWKKIFSLKYLSDSPQCPDLIAIPNYWTELLNKTDALLNLTSVDKSIRLDGCLERLREYGYKKNTSDVYSFPWWFDIAALHYREDHLKLISDNPAELLSTWDGFLEAAKSLKKHFGSNNGYAPVQNADLRGGLSHRAALPCVWSKGADIADKKFRMAGFSGEAFKEGVRDFVALAVEKYMPILEERNSLGTISLGKASMIISRKQEISAFEGNHVDFKVKTVRMPAAGESPATYLNCINLAVVKGGCCTEEAVRLLKWLSLPENQMVYAAKTEVLPALETAFEQFLLSAPGRIRRYNEILEYSRIVGNHIAAGTLMEILSAVMSATASDIVRNKYTQRGLYAALDKANEDAQKVLDAYCDE